MMGNYICNITCSYRQPSGYCGRTGGYETCQYRIAHQPNTVIGYEQLLKKTNADRLRAMTDDMQLALFFASVSGCPHCDREIALDKCELWNDDCVSCWHDWLRQEVDHAET